VQSVEEWVAKRDAKRADKVLRREVRKVGIVEVGGARGVEVEEGEEGREEGEGKVLG